MGDTGNTPSSDSVQIVIDKEYFFKDESIHIRCDSLSIFDENEYLEIYKVEDKAYYYRYLGGIDNNILFYPPSAGKYVVNLYKNVDGQSVLLAQKYFYVYDSNSDTPCKNLIAGEDIFIDTNYYKTQLTPLSSSVIQKISLTYYEQGKFSNVYVYNDIITPNIYFHNAKQGRYYLFIDDTYADCFDVQSAINQLVMSQSSSFNSNISNTFSEYYNSLNILNMLSLNPLNSSELEKLREYYEYKTPDDIYKKIGHEKKLSTDITYTVDEKIQQKISSSQPYIKISDSRGQIANSFFVLKNVKDSYIEGSALDINNQTIPGDIEQLDVYIPDSKIKKMRFNRLNLSKNLDLSYEELENYEY
jgi:hypothetical protein